MRLKMTSLALGSHTVVIDGTRQERQTRDGLLTTFNRSYAVNPCVDAGFTCSAPTTTFAIGRSTGHGRGRHARRRTSHVRRDVTGVSAYMPRQGETSRGQIGADRDHLYRECRRCRHGLGRPHATVRIGGRVVLPCPSRARRITCASSTWTAAAGIRTAPVGRGHHFPGEHRSSRTPTPRLDELRLHRSPLPLTNFSLVDDGTTANTKLFSHHRLPAVRTKLRYPLAGASIPSRAR